ncbi:MAG: hypothetical protein QOH32_431 [Bradyrhizobium sp.]|nr:hypothetical protein [Bradyrhizobium sp.]
MTEHNIAAGSAGTARVPRTSTPGEEMRSSDRFNTAAADRGKAGRSELGRPRRRAVVVGINDYPGEVNDLPSCVNDAHAFAELLEKDYSFDEIVRLVDAEATVVNVTTALQALLANASAEDRLVFFFSGHGSTELRDGIVEECIVLHDGYLFDDAISQMTQGLPPAVLTLVMDSCFSGGLEKRLLAPVFGATGVTERAQIKAYTRPNHQEFVDHTDTQDRATAVKRFGEDIVARPSPVIGNPFDPIIGFQALTPAPASDEIRQVQMKGVLLSACLETETAAASTSATNGKSAFTFALLRSLKKLGVGAPMTALVQATQSLVKSIGLTQTPLLKEPLLPPGLGSRSFITFENPGNAAGSGSATDFVSSFMDLFKRLSQGGLTMEQSTIIQRAVDAANDRSINQQKLFGIDDAILIPAIVSVVSAAIKGQQPGAQKLFGIDDAILIPAIASVVTAAIKGQQPGGADKSLFGDAIRIAGGLVKGEQPGAQKLFGIDDAILIPAVVSVVTAAMKGQQPGGADKSLLGDAIRIAGGLVKGEQPGAQKLFGIDDAILIPAIVSVVSAAIKGQQPAGADKSLLGDVIRIAGGLVKGRQSSALDESPLGDVIHAAAA